MGGNLQRICIFLTFYRSIKALSWKGDSQCLFDFESKEITKKKITVKQSGKKIIITIYGKDAHITHNILAFW